MPRRFTGQCFECGGWGHKATDHQNNWIKQPQPVGQSEDRQSDASEQQERVAVYSFPRGHQSQSAPQEQASRRSFGGVQKGTGGDVHYGVAHKVTEATLPGFTEDFKKRTGAKDPLMLVMSPEAAVEIENHLANATDEDEAREKMWKSLATMEYVDINQLIISRRRGDVPMPIQPEGQASRGILPSSRAAALPDIGGASLPANNYRVQKPGTVRGHGQQPRQMTMRNAKIEQAWIRQQEEDTGETLDDTGSTTIRGQQNGGRQRVGNKCMTGGPGGLYGHSAQARHPDAAGGQPPRNGSFGGERRQRDRPLHWQDSEYEVAPNQVVGLNLSIRDAHCLVDRFVREQPKGSRLNVELIPVSEKDSVASGPLIKGFDK